MRACNVLELARAGRAGCGELRKHGRKLGARDGLVRAEIAAASRVHNHARIFKRRNIGIEPVAADNIAERASGRFIRLDTICVHDAIEDCSHFCARHIAGGLHCAVGIAVDEGEMIFCVKLQRIVLFRLVGRLNLNAGTGAALCPACINSCILNQRCIEIVLFSALFIIKPAVKPVAASLRVFGFCYRVPVTHGDGLCFCSALGIKRQRVHVKIIEYIDRQILFDLDVLLRACVVGRIVLTVVLGVHRGNRLKLTGKVLNFGICLIVGAVGQLLDVAHFVAVRVARVVKLQNQRAVACDVAGSDCSSNRLVNREVIVALFCGNRFGIGCTFQITVKRQMRTRKTLHIPVQATAH